MLLDGFWMSLFCLQAPFFGYSHFTPFFPPLCCLLFQGIKCDALQSQISRVRAWEKATGIVDDVDMQMLTKACDELVAVRTEV